MLTRRERAGTVLQAAGVHGAGGDEHIPRARQPAQRTVPRRLCPDFAAECKVRKRPIVANTPQISDTAGTDQGSLDLEKVLWVIASVTLNKIRIRPTHVEEYIFNRCMFYLIEVELVKRAVCIERLCGFKHDIKYYLRCNWPSGFGRMQCVYGGVQGRNVL